MKFQEAINKIDRTDREARRKSGIGFGSEGRIKMEGACPVRIDGGKLDICDYNADDWEVVEEEKPLSEKVFPHTIDGGRYAHTDVKEAIKKILECADNLFERHSATLSFNNDVGKIVGKELMT